MPPLRWRLYYLGKGQESDDVLHFSYHSIFSYSKKTNDNRRWSKDRRKREWQDKEKENGRLG